MICPEYQGPTWAVEEIYLIRSTLDGQPRYETVGTWKLSFPRGGDPVPRCASAAGLIAKNAIVSGPHRRT